MSRIFSNIFALDDIGEYDIFVSPASDKLRVVFTDIQSVNVVVVDVAVVLYHQVSPRIVKTHRTVLRPRHAVFTVAVEFYCVDWTGMGLYEGLE